MKRFSKILVAVLALALLVGVLALAISAEEPAPAVEGNFVVQGKGYETWELAIEAANNTHTIYLNADWNVASAIAVNNSGYYKNVKINLNGKNVNVNELAMAFNVTGGARLTIEGEGTFNNVGATLIGASSQGVVTINATGAGLVINTTLNNANVDVNTFRFLQYSVLNVSGKLTANTLGVTKSRALFNVSDSHASIRTVTLNINDADILYAKPSEEALSAPQGKFIYAHYSKIVVNNSNLKSVGASVYYCAQNDGYVDLSGYLEEYTKKVSVTLPDKSKAERDVYYVRYIESKLDDLKADTNLQFATNDSITANNSVFRYAVEGYGKSGLNDTGLLMNVLGSVKGEFTNCEFYGVGRAIFGNSSYCVGTDMSHGQDASTVTARYRKANRSQLVFNDCHFRNSDTGKISYLFCYGPNFKMIGGSVVGINNGLANGQPWYVELDNGQFLGCYVDNVLGVSGLSNNREIETRWQNATRYNPASIYTGTLPKAVSIVVDGKVDTITTGYFSSEEKFDSYFNKTTSINVAGITTKSEGNFEGADYYIIKDKSSVAASTLGITFASKLSTTVVTAGLNVEAKKDVNGNGYVKFYYAYAGKDTTRYSEIYISGNPKATNNKPSKAEYNFTTHNYQIQEIDIATTTGKFLNWNMNLQGRAMLPYLDATGTKIGASGIYQPTIADMFVITNNQLVVGSNKVNLATDGSWNRITWVTEAIVGDAVDAASVEGLQIPVYGTDLKTTGEYLSKDAMTATGLKVRKIDVYHHIYLNGEFVGTKHSWGGDYMNSGLCSGYTLVEADGSDWAITNAIYSFRGTGSTIATDADICFDNTRSSIFAKGTDIGIYDGNGKLLETLPKNEHFLVMPENKPVTGVAIVDGTLYYSESDVIAAIKEGSVVELGKNFESYLPSYINEEKGNVSYTLIPNGYSFPGFVSSTHMVVDYMDGLGYYKLVKAPENEIFTINYSFNGVTETKVVALGTVIPELTKTFPSKIEGNKAISVTGWTIPEVISNYALTSNVINAEPIIEEGVVVAIAGGAAFSTLESAIDGANGETIILLDDVTVNSQIYVDAKDVKLNLNGKTITAGEGASSVFNVRRGSNFTIEGAGVINNVNTFISASDLGAATHSTVNVNADAASTGIVINHRTVDDGADSDTQLTAFRFYDKSILNVSGFLTVNAYNGMRVVFNVVSGSGTEAATALNISRAKIYVPVLGRSAEGIEYPKGYSRVIEVSHSSNVNTAVNIDDSEIRATFGQIFRVTGTANTSDISSYRNEDFTWKENAASSITLSNPKINILVKNSTLYSEWGGYGTKQFSAKYRAYPSIMALSADAYVHFDKTNIYFDFRGITTTDATGEGIKVNHSQILFTDCNIMDAPSTNADAPFMLYGPNFKMIGGTWASSNWISNGSHNHLDLDNGRWIGSYLDGVLFANKFNFLTAPDRWGDNTTTEPDSYRICNVTKIIDGTAYNFKHAYFSDFDAYEEIIGLLAYANTFNNGTNDTFGYFSGSGLGEITKTNGYVRHYFSGAMSKDTYSNLNADPSGINYNNIGTYVWEFDISTDTGYFAETDIGIEGREQHPVFAEDGSYIGYVNAKNLMDSVRYAAGGSFSIADDYVKFNGRKAYISTETGEWSRITVVVNIVLGDERTETVPVYTKTDRYETDSQGKKHYYVEEVEGKTMEIQVVDLTESTVSIYVNGELLDCVQFVYDTQYFNGAISKDYLAGGYIDDLRIRNYPSKECSILYDNIVFMPISRTSGVDLGVFDAKGKPASSLEGNKYFGLADLANKAFEPVVSVDGVEYESVKEANAAIKENSIVELLADITEPIEINYNNIKFKTNGKSYPGFISSAYTALDYTAARGALYSVPASADEIVTITFPAYGGVAETQQNAVIGSYLKVPAAYDAVARVLDKEAKQYKLLSWSLSEDGNVMIVTAAGNAYPVFDTVDAVVVNWTDASGLVVLHTDYYFPGENTVLDEFDGQDLEDDISADYYSYGRTGWDKDAINAATAGLATGGSYDIAAIMGKKAPDTFPGLMYNLSLYSNFVMNLYVPADIEGVSNVTVSRTSNGSVGITKFENGTLYGKEYEKYGYMLGVADASMQTFYIVYNVGEDTIAFPVYVSVPEYADIIMGKDYEADEATKTLIVNMANYATKVLAINDGDMTSEGAQIYADIIAHTPESLDYYNQLTND